MPNKNEPFSVSKPFRRGSIEPADNSEARKLALVILMQGPSYIARRAAEDKLAKEFSVI